MRHPVAASAWRTAAAALAWLLLAPAQAGAAPRALVAFLPASEQESGRLLDAFADRRMAVGLVSPTVGGYSPGQMALDVGQGARVSSRVYSGDVPPLRLLAAGRGGRVAGFDRAVHRAEDAGGDLVPGLLADAVIRGGGRVAYAGVEGDTQIEAAAAADRAGRMGLVTLGPPGSLAERAAALQRDADLVVARLPAGRPGLAALDRLLAARGREGLVIALRAPPPGDRLRLLPAGAAGTGSGGRLRSATTRRSGLVAATDIAPTVLRSLRLDEPDDMQGEPIETAAGGDAAARTRELGERLGVIVSRRGLAIPTVVLSWLGLVALAALLGRGAALRTALRIVFLSGLWLPAAALLTAALEPSRWLEVALLTATALALGALVDRLVRWPVAPFVPAAVVFAVQAVDLAAGSPLTALSLAGPSPRGGARFFGIGNELEALLAVSVLTGAGAGLVPARPSRVPAGFGAVCLLAAAILGAGRLGADVGAVITLGAGAAAAIVLSLPGGPSRRAVALAVALPVAALAGLVAIDVLTGGGAHFTRSVLEAGGPGDLADVAKRRFELSWKSLTHGLTPLTAALAAAALAVGFARRRALVAPLAGVPGGRAFAAGLGGALAATIVGALANDSGPVILVAGAVGLLLATGYVQGRPAESLSGSASR